MPSVSYPRAQRPGTCDGDFAHPGAINSGDITRVTTYFPSDEHVQYFGVLPFTRYRTCQWCVIRDAMQDARQDECGLLMFRDRHGDLWQFGPDGLLHTRETAPFEFEHVQKKWGPLRVVKPGV